MAAKVLVELECGPSSAIQLRRVQGLCSTSDVAQVLMGAARAMTQHPAAALSGRLLQTPEQVAEDYPAAVLSPTMGAALCAACLDLYGPLAEGALIALPPDLGVAVPCTFHLHPSRRPYSVDRAIKLRNDEDEAAGNLVAV